MAYSSTDSSREMEIEFRNVGFRGGRKTGENLRGKDENQQETQPTYDTGTGNRSPAALVGGERSHHCAISVPLSPAYYLACLKRL